MTNDNGLNNGNGRKMRIFLVRHGESTANIDEYEYARRQDHDVPLTEWGYEQAMDAGQAIDAYYMAHPELKEKKVLLFHSPYKRALQTKDAILQTFKNKEHIENREDFLLIEQDFGLFADIRGKEDREANLPNEYKKFLALQAKEGKFYARPPLGESSMDVARRVRMFKDTLMRKYYEGVEDFVIISHASTIRAFEMDFLHKGIKWLDNAVNPENAEVILLEGNDGSYTATTLHKGKHRTEDMPKDLKTHAVGEKEPLVQQDAVRSLEERVNAVEKSIKAAKEAIIQAENEIEEVMEVITAIKAAQAEERQKAIEEQSAQKAGGYAKVIQPLEKMAKPSEKYADRVQGNAGARAANAA